jgi:hypothetical protein
MGVALRGERLVQWNASIRDEHNARHAVAVYLKTLVNLKVVCCNIRQIEIPYKIPV